MDYQKEINLELTRFSNRHPWNTDAQGNSIEGGALNANYTLVDAVGNDMFAIVYAYLDGAEKKSDGKPGKYNYLAKKKHGEESDKKRKARDQFKDVMQQAQKNRLKTIRDEALKQLDATRAMLLSQQNQNKR